MRLTIVDQVHLPEGQLRSHVLKRSGGVGHTRELPVSFDQRRHVLEGQRRGSWMAVAFRLPEPVDDDRLAQAWEAVVQRHGTLRSAFVARPPRSVVLHEIELRRGGWVDHPAQPGVGIRDRLREVLDEACAPFARPSHRLCVVQPADGPPSIVIAADHSHVDAWSLLVLVRDLTTCLDDLTAGRAPGADLPPAPAFSDHTHELASRPPVPEDVVARWREILDAGDGAMPTFPLSLGDLSEPRTAVVEVHDVLDYEQLARFEEHCRGIGASMLAVSLAESCATADDLAGAPAPLRAIFPVHSRYDDRWHDSVGWFITNSVIEVPSPDPAACHRAVKEAVVLGSHPLEPIMAPYGGMPMTPGNFAVSWLDNRRLPVAVPPGLEPQHVSAVVRTDGVMIWFVVNATGLHLRCRYPGTPEARRSVGDWLDGVRQRLQARVASSVGPVPD
ncbi:Condensation domain-containing protein [Nocardioides exalbidus]|uniref:Condensation domain-containing protein n=1 Tax=Nocardioides exalbidus TaxID=402596 RepID=A0A1H4KXQ8_9ACTN|nr:condensation domain-containing protein [Nocardioides exalbidus]SEB63006.1 Condensation domain-containing protein [Nocardioides exalbidus]